MNAFPHIDYAARTDVGRKRKNNEDAFGVFPDAGIFCVADGMGGGDDGEIASAAVVKSVGEFATSHVPPTGVGYVAEDVAAGVSHVVNEASAWISARAAERKLKGCGSTFVGICLDATAPSAAIVLHAGDSRLYRVRGSSIKQITKDHSAAEMIGVKDEKSVNPMFRGMILRAVGVHPSVYLERTPLAIKDGDRIVICSDGLSKMVDDRNIAAIVQGGSSAESAADELVAAANEAGGTDNVTAVVLFVGRLPPALPSIVMELPDSGTCPTEDDGEADTFSTAGGGEFGDEPDTADETQTLNTITVKMQRTNGVGGAEPTTAPARPMPIRTSAAHKPVGNGRAVRCTLAALAGLLLIAIVAFCAIYFPRLAKERRAATEAERQRTVQKLAEANARTEVVSQNQGKTIEISDTDKSIVESVESELDKGMDTHIAVYVPKELVEACSPANSGKFVKTVRRFPVKCSVETLQMRFRPLCDATLSVERRLALASAVAADVQDIVRELRNYSERRIGHIDAALSEHTTRAEFKSGLAEERGGLAAFMDATEKFDAMDSSSVEAQIVCAKIMSGIAQWFGRTN